MFISNQIVREDRRKPQLPFWLIVVLIVYLPLEEFILKLLPLPITVIAAIRSLPELVCYLLFFGLLYQIITRRCRFKITAIEILFVGFFIWAVFLIIISHLFFQASLFGGVSGLRTLVRFLSVYYLLVNLELYDSQIYLILQTMIGMGMLEGLIAMAQFLGGSPVKKIFETTSVKMESLLGKAPIAFVGFEKKGSVFGTFSDASVMALFFLIPAILAVTLVIYWTYIHPKKRYYLLPNWQRIIVLFLIYFGIISSYKRAVMLIALLLPILVIFYLGKPRIAAWLTLLYGTLLLVLFWGIMLFSFNIDQALSNKSIRKEGQEIKTYLIQLFTPEYWNRSIEGSRLFFMKISCGNVLGSGYWYGLSPDEDTTVEQLVKLTNNTRDKVKFKETSLYFKDAYWCAMISFYGVPGTLIYLLILYQLYRHTQAVRQNASGVVEKLLGVSGSILILLYGIYSLAEQLPEARTCSFYFWTIAGLVVNVHNRQKSLKS